ncbi:fimbrial protein [Salmonella enterica subsp. enterica serovar Tennessee]|nr:fimbrial protein [Salmonella enterica subsp. enterica serovar Tennessee]
MRGGAIKSMLMNKTGESRSGRVCNAALILCLFISSSAEAHLWVRSGPGHAYISPEQLHFRTGKAGDEVSMPVTSVKGVPFTMIWHSTKTDQTVAEAYNADFYESYVSHQPPGSDAHWYKLTDILEFSAQNTYYKIHNVESSLHFTFGLRTDFLLSPEGAHALDSFYEPWAKGITIRFRLTKDAVDTPVFIPAMDLFSVFSLYAGEYETTGLEAFGGRYPPEWTFSINSGFISVPDAACSVSPASLDVDFGAMPPSRVNGTQQKKELQITCNKNAALKFSVQGVGSTMDNGVSVLKMSNKDDIVARIKTDNLADQQGYFPLSVKKDVPTSVPFFFELQSTGSKASPAPGKFDGAGWIIFNYE